MVPSRVTRATPARARRFPRRRPRAQALSEYVIVLVMFIGIAVSLSFFLSIFMEQGWRILHLIGLEYP